MPGVFAITKEVMDVVLDVMRVVTSADKAYAYLREQGYDWTRAFVREAWKETGLKDAWATVAETYGTDRPIPKAWVIEKKGGLEPGYQVNLKFTYQDMTTGEIETKYVSQIYDKVVPYSQAVDDMEDYLEEYEAVFGWVPISLTPGGVFRLTGPKR
jgi:hypothetical protein